MIERKEGVTYYRCEHLDNGTMESEDGLIWLGDTRRLIMCPLCQKLEFGNQMTNFMVLSGRKQKKIDQWWKGFVSWAVGTVKPRNV